MPNRTSRYSHYGPGPEGSSRPIPLKEHLKDVANRVDIICPGDAETPDGHPLRPLTRRSALVHDFGKLTSYFQAHLDDRPPGGPKEHSPLGAFAAFYVLRTTGYDPVDALLGYTAVAKHHGSLPDVADYVFNTVSEATQPADGRIATVRTQVSDIDEHVPSLAEEIIAEATDGEGSWKELRFHIAEDEWLGELLKPVTGYLPTNAQSDALPPSFYDALLPAWSSLTLADKTGAAAVTTGASLSSDAYAGTKPSSNRIRDHVKQLQGSLPPDASSDERDVHKLRASAHEEVMSNVPEFVKSDYGIASLTLPTGLGKTLTGLRAGLTVLERNGGDGRLIYALPYTSIIDQVAETCREVFPTDRREGLLTVDHHLADTSVELDKLDLEDHDEAARIETLLGESWRAGLVVTTFVQLFESLAGPSNGQSTKLPALDDSVVVIDEPQALPEAWWPLVRRVSRILSEQFDATLIAMTATQPRVFEAGTETDPFHLVEKPSRYYEILDRVVFELDDSALSYVDGSPNPLEYEVAGNLISEAIMDGSVLSVCNTIDSARELTSAVRKTEKFLVLNDIYADHLADAETLTTETSADDLLRRIEREMGPDRPVLLHLTTRHRPIDRELLLDTTNRLLERDRTVLAVTTQLVEAGVDISFDTVFRDLAPMSSIVQAAGRCNRSFERDRGRVTVWLLEAPGSMETLPSTAVYGGRDSESRLRLTAQAVDAIRDHDQSEFDEPTMTWDAVTEYFRRLHERNPGNTQLAEYVDDALAEHLARTSLIGDRGGVDVIVTRTEAERDLLEEAADAFETADYDALTDVLETLKPLQVSIPMYDEYSEEAKQVSNLDPIHAGSDVRIVDARRDDHGAFDPLEGLSIPSETVENRFL